MLESQSYTVSENEGSVQICAVVLGLFERPVAVNVFTFPSSGSAQGKVGIVYESSQNILQK